MVMDNQTKKVFVFLLTRKYFDLACSKKELTFFNFLDYVRNYFQGEKQIEWSKLIKFLHETKSNDVITFMLEDAKTNPKKYI